MPCLPEPLERTERGTFANSMPVLFIGTGIMGNPMCRNLARAGFRVLAWNRSPEKLASLPAAGVEIVPNLELLPDQPLTVIFMVSTGAVVDDLLFGETGLAKRLAPASCVVVMSSIPVETAQRQAQALVEFGIGYVDAPVSGGERGATDATLSIMAGGSATDLERVAPVLSQMGVLHHIGPPGTGQLAKLANQAIVGITIGAVAEAFHLAAAGGANLEAVRNALMGGFAASEILSQHGSRMIEHAFAPGAKAHVQLKDVSTALNLAKQHGLDTPLLQQVTDLYAEMCKNPELCELDHSALFLLLDRPFDPNLRGH